MKKRIAKYDPVAMAKYREKKKETTVKVTIEGVKKESWESFKKEASELGISQRELFEKKCK